jgi:4-amino-4-deoxy-L-arabinose transferase-like glycosyltransferase
LAVVLAGRPVLVSFLIALVVRLVAVVVINLVHDGTLIPDEGQYLILALMASEGELPSDFWAGYGQSLFDSTRVFMWPLTALFWLFGPSRFVAQLLPALFGAVTAAAAAGLAGRFLRRPYALAAGLMVAVFPSQVLWSSVVLRESMIWAGLAGIALVVAYSQRQDSGVRILWSAVAVGLLFVALAWLRDQTAALALLCLFPALLLGKNRRGLRVLCATGVLVVAPWIVGMGPGAGSFLYAAIGRTGTAHAYMSMEADSSFSVFSSESVDDCAARLEHDSGEWREIGNLSGVLIERERGDWLCIHDNLGGAVLVDNRLTTSIGRVPYGLYHTMFRPFPWESGSDLGLRAAGLESPLWITVYGLSGYGVWRFRRRYWPMAFPVLLVGAVALSGAMTHGNLGTAFRHRGQMLFALAALSAGGLQAIVDNYRCRRIGRAVVDSADTGSSDPVPNPGLPAAEGT